MTSKDQTGPDAFLTDQQFDELAQGRLAEDALAELRVQVQVVLDDPTAAVSHESVWSRLEQRMKRAVARAA